MDELVHPASGLSKTTWTDRDFEMMGWHDSWIHALSVQEYDDEETLPPNRVVLDLDYIVAWVEPRRPARHFTFWIAPVTLVFEQAWNIDGTVHAEMEVADLHRLPCPDAYPDPLWHLEGHMFELRLRAPRFTQYVRREPVHVARQRLTTVQRGGISLAEHAYDGAVHGRPR